MRRPVLLRLDEAQELLDAVAFAEDVPGRETALSRRSGAGPFVPLSSVLAPSAALTSARHHSRWVARSWSPKSKYRSTISPRGSSVAKGNRVPFLKMMKEK